MKLRNLFSKQTIIPELPAKVKWENRDWWDITISTLTVAIMLFSGLLLLIILQAFDLAK